jgi:two-component system, LytTR family, response regulator
MTAVKLKTLVVEDEPVAMDHLLSWLNEMACILITDIAQSVDEALIKCSQNMPDLVFLDVELQNGSGFDLVEAFGKMEAKPYIIFVTAHQHYAIQAIRCAAFDFLLKPFLKEELHQAVNRVLARQLNRQEAPAMEQLLAQLKQPRRLRFNTRSGYILVDPADIDYIQADWNYSELFLANGKTEMLSMNIGSVEKVLPCGRFHRINRSIIINLDKLLRVDRKNKSCLVQTFEGEKVFDLPARRIKSLEGFL